MDVTTAAWNFEKDIAQVLPRKTYCPHQGSPSNCGLVSGAAYDPAESWSIAETCAVDQEALGHALEPGLTARPPVKVYSDGMKMKAGTLDDMFYALIEQLEREEPVLRERHRRMLHDVFVRMAEKEHPRSYEEIREAYRRNRHKYWRAGVEPEPEPLPPLSPGKARVVSF